MSNSLGSLQKALILAPIGSMITMLSGARIILTMTNRADAEFSPLLVFTIGVVLLTFAAHCIIKSATQKE